MPIPVSTKPRMHCCPDCGRRLPRTQEFWHRNRARPDGMNATCRECARERARATKDRCGHTRNTGHLLWTSPKRRPRMERIRRELAEIWGGDFATVGFCFLLADVLAVMRREERGSWREKKETV